jgi:hypothetical protein
VSGLLAHDGKEDASFIPTSLDGASEGRGKRVDSGMLELIEAFCLACIISTFLVHTVHHHVGVPCVLEQARRGLRLLRGEVGACCWSRMPLLWILGSRLLCDKRGR